MTTRRAMFAALGLLIGLWGCGRPRANTSPAPVTPPTSERAEPAAPTPPEPSAPTPATSPADVPALGRGLVPCKHSSGPSFFGLPGWELHVFEPDRVKMSLEGRDGAGGFDYAVLWIGLPDEDGRDGAEVIAALNGPRPAVVSKVDGWTCTAPPSAGAWDPELAERLHEAPRPEPSARRRDRGAEYYSCAGPSTDGTTLLVTVSVSREEWHRLGGASFLVGMGRGAKDFDRSGRRIEPWKYDCFDSETSALGQPPR